MTISYQSAGALNYQTTASFAVAHPASIAAGDYLVLLIGQKPDTASVTTPAGWTLLNTTAGGAGTTGVDTGPTRVSAYGKEAVGGETGNLAVTHATTNVGWAQMLRFTKTTGTWGAFSAGGVDSTTGAAWSASITAANGQVAAGDFLIVGAANPTDVDAQPQFTAQAVSATGLTMGTMTAISEPESLSNNDIGGFVFIQAVTSGSNTTNLTVAATRGGTTTNISGPSVVVRLREVAAPTNVTVTPTALATGEAFGTAVVNVVTTVSPTALATGEAFGTAVVSTFLTATPTAITTGEAFGTAVAVVPITATPTAIATSEAFGTAVANVVTTVSPTALATSEAFGTAVVSVAFTATPTAITTGEAFGTAVVSTFLTAAPTAIATGEAFGTAVATATLTVTPAALVTSEAFGTAIVSTALTASPTAIETGAAFGTAVVIVPLVLSPTAIATSEAFGTAVASTVLTASPAAITASEAFGTAVVSTLLTASPTAIETGAAFGAPSISTALTVSLTGISSAETFGTLSAQNIKSTTGTATATASTSATSTGTHTAASTQTATAGVSATTTTIRTTSATATAHGAATAISGGVRPATGTATAVASASSSFTTNAPTTGTASAIASANSSHTSVRVTSGTATVIASATSGGETAGTARAIASANSQNSSARAAAAAATAVASVSSSFTSQRITVAVVVASATASSTSSSVRSTQGTATATVSVEFTTTTIHITQAEAIAVASASSEQPNRTTVGEAVAIISATAYTYRLEKTLMICYPETTNWGATDPVLINNERRQLAEAFAWTTLHVLGGRMIAICPSAVRPIRPRCRDSYVFDRFGVYDLSANVYPAFEHLAGCMCDRTSVITLPGLVGRIQRITIDGVDLPAYAYRVEDGQRLVRQDGSAWPAWQDMSLTVGGVGTFEIVYWDGIAPNAMLNYAAGVLANEYLKLLTGEKGCRLPKAVTQVSRQGVTYTIDSSIFANGVTDIKEVDNVIALYNPNKLKAPPVVYSTDLHSTRLRSRGV